jgi:sugar (pentulose or hexulose) kinase
MPYAATWFAVAQGPATVSASWLVELATQLLADAGLIGISRDELVAILEHHATAAAPGAVLFAPGSPAAEQASPDLPAGFTGISGATTFYDLLRSLHEGQALAARAGYGALGGSPAVVRLAGVGAASRLARQVLAAHVDAPVRMVRRERPAAAGAALIATIALAHYPTLADATRDWVEPHLGDLEPVDPDLRAVYARRFPATPAASRGRVA